MNHVESMLKEFAEEVATTRRVLDRVPADKLGWRPHERAMSLGQLALHLASVPGDIVYITKGGAFDVSQANFNRPSPTTLNEVNTALDQSVLDVERTLRECTEERAREEWRLMFGEKELSSMPRVSVWRSLMLNHWYHHRGQLTVYLRLLDIPVPSIYGPSADESPFR